MDLRRLAVSLIILIVGLGILFYLSKSQSRPQPAQETKAPAPSIPPAASGPTGTPVVPAPVKTAPVITSAPGKPEIRWFGTQAELEYVTIGSLNAKDCLVQLQLASEGAGIYTAKLSEYFVTVADKQLYNRDPNGYQAKRQANPEKYKGHYSLLNPVPLPDGRLLPLATRSLSIQIEGEPNSNFAIEDLNRRPWLLEESNETSARFSYTLYRGKNRQEAMDHPVLKLFKTYEVHKGDYSVSVSLAAENLFGKPVRIWLDQLGPTGVPEEDPRTDTRAAVYGTYKTEDGRVQVVRKSPGDLQKMGIDFPAPVGRSDSTPPVVWLGQVNKFFGSMMYLAPEVQGRLYSPEWRAEFYVEAEQESPTSRTYATGLKIPDLVLLPGKGPKEVRFDLFIGPKSRDLFSTEGFPGFKALYKQLDYIGVIDFGSCCCTWAPLTLAVMWLLNVLAKLSFGNYGVAIILLVFLVRLLLHPLTKKGQVSMMKMQKLAPQIQKLKEKYADDKNTLNKEMMALYKQQGASPFLGFLPMFLQMPIWVALYAALNAAVELRHAGFLPVWITDLAGPDALFTWSSAYSLPLIGHTFNMLPILLTIAMYFQTKMTPQMAQAAVTKEQKTQQKMMQYMMPVMMLFFLYSAPSGLTLYIMASTFSSVIEQIVIKKHIQAREAAAAAAETTVALPGKGFRTGRPKKPKGPFWVKRG